MFASKRFGPCDAAPDYSAPSSGPVNHTPAGPPAASNVHKDAAPYVARLIEREAGTSTRRCLPGVEDIYVLWA